jgi:hypothetical protein
VVTTVPNFTGVISLLTVDADQDPVTVGEGSTATNTGTFENVGGGTVTISASIGSITQDDVAKTWAWSYLSTDGPTDSQTITITAEDDSGPVATTTFQLIVVNVAPTATLSNNGPKTYGQTVTLTFAEQYDPSTADTLVGFRYAYATTDDFTGITYATGSITQATYDFTSLPAGSHTLYARIIDKDNGYTQYSTVVQVDKADAVIVVSGKTVTYDGDPHGASGTATGVQGEALAGLDLGASFTNVPGGTANWTFTDMTGNYNDANGSVAIVINKADATLDVSGVTVTYDGDAHGASGHGHRRQGRGRWPAWTWAPASPTSPAARPTGSSPT